MTEKPWWRVPPGSGLRRLRRHRLAAVLLVAAACSSGFAAVAAAESALVKALALRAAGRLDEALDMLRAESREVKKTKGDDAPDLLPINDLAAEILIDKGDLETAGNLLDKTIATRERLLESGKRENSAALAGSLIARARLESAAKRLPAAVAAARRAIAVLDAAPDRDPAAVARAGEALATAVNALETLLGVDAEPSLQARDDAAGTFAASGMFGAAIEERSKILAALVARGDASAEDVRDATDRVARLLIASGRAAEAAGIVEESLAAIGPDNARESIALRRLLGEAQLAADWLVLAAGSFASVLAATQAEPTGSPAALAADRLRVVLVAARRGAVDRAPDWFDAAVKGFSKPATAETADAIAGLALAGAVQEALARPDVARPLLEKALALAGGAKPPDPALVAELSARVAAVQLAVGDAAGARATLDRALPAAAKDLGSGATAVGILRVLVARTLERLGKTDEAAAAVVAALEHGLPRPDEAWEESSTKLTDRLATTAGHGDLRERYLAARTVQFGAESPHLATTVRLFGAARLAAGDWQAAVDLIGRAADIERAGLGDDHPETAATLVLLAHAKRAAGDPRGSAATATQALAAWGRAGGRHHPGTLSAADVLVAAKIDSGDTAGALELLESSCAADTADDPAHRAARLVRLADMTAPRDAARARDLLGRALELPCWNENDAGPDQRRRLALTAALAAHAFREVDDTAAATKAAQRARELAMRQSDDPKPLLDRIEALAERGEGPLPAGQ